MRKPRRPYAPGPSVGLKVMELLLIIFNVWHGAWQLKVAWGHSGHIGWVPSGIILITGMLICAWLLWLRRETARLTLIPVMWFSQLAGFVRRFLTWQAGSEGAVFPWGEGLFVIVCLGLIIKEERDCRKEAAEDVTRETKIFGVEDRL